MTKLRVEEAVREFSHQHDEGVCRPDCYGCFIIREAKADIEAESAALRAEVERLKGEQTQGNARIYGLVMELEDRQLRKESLEVSTKERVTIEASVLQRILREKDVALLQVESSRKALEEIVCMQHMHEGAGGCHGGCPICCASVAIGLDKYLRNPGDKEKVETLSVKHGYTEKPKGAPCYMCHGSGTRGGLPCPECAVKQMDLRQPKTLDDLTEIR